MINELINFATELFPSINPYTKENVKNAIKQFELEGKKINFFLLNSFDYLGQGDIIGELPFIFADENGELFGRTMKGIVLSNTCDCERDDYILIAPFVPIKEIEKDIIALKNNITYGFLFFPDKKYENEIVDFSLSMSFPRKLVIEGLKNGKFKKYSSLNTYGYYLFLIKLTIYFMRPEDKGVQNYRYRLCNLDTE